MTLFPDLDKELTKENVDELLSSCRSLIRYVHEDYIPKVTQTYSFEIKGSRTDASPLENGVLKKVNAEQELVAIVRALNRLNAYDSKILYDKYMDKNEYSDKQLIAKYESLDEPRSERSFYRDLDRAMGKFAEAFDGGRLLAVKWQ
ncbi:ArpU family phage packaging/lysis transcriptional regulator [Carnobacterium maltaromaticum]|uniref:ArpU family phage packaging/lysis transcriptional regulator n=1 Tax=Carnobacterium maltaromaticum TaxID=2751 RepID=UPI0039BDB3EF